MAHYRIGTAYIGQFSSGAEPPEEAVECPAPETAFQEWSGSAWVNGEDALAANRSIAEIDRVVFLLGLFNMDKITTEIADEASDGSWPSAWNADIAALSLEGRMEIKAAWKSADTVAYYGMFLQKIALLAQTATAPITVTQAELDTVFGVSA